MRQLMVRLWQDDCGALLSVEWVFVATILVIGSIVGLVAVRQAIIHELEDFAEAIIALSTSWRFHDFDFDDDDDLGHHHRHHDNGQHNGQNRHHGDDFNSSLASLGAGGD